ncbi:DNA repair ATPase [Aeromonas diversa CDC 2478-85]|uniref:DUF2799 domain-containing protein n=2 Tax=Aeromonas TaxID=642 RepID=A0ABS7V988_9GAMM|nr:MULTISPECIES: DUF2799 domain-containing protein [Aeromonas]ENY73213.1 DNA repair ATPase [Aeromonas diversa CDC 2478-85]MBZ6065474.1 DUF2799 domain-containing protein [Aeromonas schubertii]
MPMRLFLLSLTLLLGGCAALSEEECHNTNWNHLGYQDGERGRPRDVFKEYGESCAEYGVRPDSVEWDKGYQKGLELYCIPELAYRKGRDGEEYLGVCPNDASFMKQYQRGRDEYLIQKRIGELQQELSSLNTSIGTLELQLRNSKESSDRSYYRSQLDRANRRATAIEQEIWRLRNPPTVIQFKL